MTLFQSIIAFDKVIDLDATFVVDELLKVIKGFGKGEAPSWNGATLEFLIEIWDVLKDAMLCMASKVWQKWDAYVSWKEGLLILIAKTKLC